MYIWLIPIAGAYIMMTIPEVVKLVEQEPIETEEIMLYIIGCSITALAAVIAAVITSRGTRLHANDNTNALHTELHAEHEHILGDLAKQSDLTKDTLESIQQTEGYIKKQNELTEQLSRENINVPGLMAEIEALAKKVSDSEMQIMEMRKKEQSLNWQVSELQTENAKLQHELADMEKPIDHLPKRDAIER